MFFLHKFGIQREKLEKTMFNKPRTSTLKVSDNFENLKIKKKKILYRNMLVYTQTVRNT